MSEESRKNVSWRNESAETELDEEEELYDDPGPSTSRKAVGKGDTSKKGKKPLVNCRLCGRPYRSMKGYQSHLNMHAVADLLQNAPGKIAVRDECRRVYSEILQDFHGLKPTCGYTESVCNVAELLQTFPLDEVQHFVDRTAEMLYSCLPDMSVTDIEKFHTAGKTHMVILENREELLDLLKAILDPAEFSVKALNWFLTNFLRKLSSKVEAMFIQCLREPSNNLLCCSGDDRDDNEDLNFQQSLHYVGGSTVKSVMRKAWKRRLTMEPWKCIYDCMLTKFVVGDNLTGPGEEIELWTNAMDRGGLQKINHKVWSFLVALSGVLKSEEKEDGSILHENVLKIVRSDDVLMFLWNDITQNSLDEETDNVLLQNFCEFFTNTWLQGVILRRKNAISKISRDKVSLRSRLAT